MKTPWIAALLLAFGSAAASAAPVYRCGGGTYSQTPCPGGTVVDATDTRSAAQRAEARRVAAEERRKAREMERERLAAEKAAQREPAIASLGPEKSASEPARPGVKAAGKRKAKKAKKAEGPEHFTAVAPSAKKER
jgi:hypothetical protein